MSAKRDWAVRKVEAARRSSAPALRIFRGLAVATALLVLRLGFAQAHSSDHPELDDWLMGQHNLNNGMCCDGNDVIALSDSEWRIQGSHYEVVLRGAWTPIEPWMLTQSPENRMSTALLWVWQGHVQCFKPGTFY